jgi:AcrR family transcriptional regulator
VGSLYQYFPNRDAVVAALLEREAARLAAALEAVAARADLPLAAHVRALVAAAHATRAGQPALELELRLQALRLGGGAAAQAASARQRAAVRQLVERHAAGLRPLDVGHASFLVFEAIEWLTFSAVARHRLDHPKLVDEIASLVTRYLAP